MTRLPDEAGYAAWAARAISSKRMRALVAAVVAIVAGMAASASAGVDPLLALRPSVRAYTERDGLPQGTIHAIVFDRQGFLWVGTQDGAARFNGRVWVRFDMPDRTVSNFVRAVLPTRDGSLWFGREEGGLVRLRQGVSTIFGRNEGLPAGRVNHLLEASDGRIWAATHGGGVALFTGSGFVPVAEGLPDLRVWQLLEGRDFAGGRRLLAACEGGVAELREGSRWVALDLGTALEGVSVNSLLETGEGAERTLWAGTFGAGLFRVKGGRVTRFGPGSGLSSRLVTSLAATPGPGGDPVVWAGTRDAGVFRLTEDSFERVLLGAPINEVYTLAGGVGVDAETLWVGTRVSGLLRVQQAPWSAFDRASGLPGDQVFCFLEASDQKGRRAIWIGTNSGAAVLAGGHVETHGLAKGLPASQVRSLASLRTEGGGRDVWASVVGSGLYQFDGRRWRHVDAGPSFRAGDAAVLLAVDDGEGPAELWVGTEKSGLGRLVRGRWSSYGVAEGLPSDSILSLLSTRGKGGRTVWVGTRGGGLAEMAGGHVVAVHDRGSGLPNNNILSLAEVSRLDGRRELWVGTRGGVARRFLDTPDASWSLLSVESNPPLPNDSVFFVAPGRDGLVYLGTNRGVARVSLSAGGAGPGEALTFGTNEGLPSAACNQGSLVDSEGRIWVATNAGAAVLDPGRKEGRARRPHPLVIERFEVSGVTKPAKGELRLTPKERDVAFEFSLLAFHSESLVRYRTQLAGWEGAPSDWVPSHRREFTNLPPGRYAFRVWGRDAEASVSGPVEVRFEVTESWWRQPAALVLWALLAAALGLAAIRVRERTLRRRAEELEALVALRTRELSEARDAAEAATESKSRFLAHMAHEVRTPLNAILGYSDLLAEEMRDRGTDDLLVDLEKIHRAASHQLSLVTEALDLGKIEAGKAELHLTTFDAARLVREAAEIAWPLVKKGHNRLESSGVDALGTVFSDEGKLRQVLLNLLSNAARFTEKGTISIEAAHVDDTLTIRVRDTGVGISSEQLERVFTPYAQASAGTSAVYGGTGLGLMLSRGYCELMRGSLDVESEPGKGSTFTVRLPVRLERRGGAR
jgi:signal transduction histidine kinase/ligand-binding sensor domain-containing protein